MSKHRLRNPFQEVKAIPRENAPIANSSNQKGGVDVIPIVTALRLDSL